MFLILAIIVPPVIFFTEGDIPGALLFLLLMAGIGIPVFYGSWHYSPQKYKVSEKGVFIIRPAANIVIPIKEINKVEPKDYKSYKLLRKWGNGGLFSISGKFWNKADGDFWCYGKNTNFVMLHADKKWVVTPDEKELFITDVKGKMEKVQRPSRSHRKKSKHSK